MKNPQPDQVVTCCVCEKPVVSVYHGGDGITVLTGPPPDNLRQAHFECAKKKKLEWFNSGAWP